jgi:hypothetical protein
MSFFLFFAAMIAASTCWCTLNIGMDVQFAISATKTCPTSENSSHTSGLHMKKMRQSGVINSCLDSEVCMQSHPTAHPQIDSEFYVLRVCNVGTISIMSSIFFPCR